MLYDGTHRKEYAACLIESFNIPHLRTERGKWRQRLVLKFIFEDLPNEQNYVKFNPDQPDLPETIFVGNSEFALKLLGKVLNHEDLVHVFFSFERCGIRDEDELHSKNQGGILSKEVCFYSVFFSNQIIVLLD